MTQEEALLAAIAEAPQEDDPRLVYADWLEENGQAERGEFIRLQVELFRLGPNHPRSPALMQRQSQLWAAHALGWPARVPALPGVTWLDACLRGFPFHATVASPKAFREQADRLFAAAPVQSLVLRRLTPRTARTIVASPYLRRLTHLDLTGNRLGDEGVAALVASPHLTNLNTLRLRDTGVADDGAAALAGAPLLANLTWLDLDENEIGDRGALALAASPHLNRVTHLRWVDNLMGPQGQQALFQRFGGRYAALMAHVASRNGPFGQGGC